MTSDRGRHPDADPDRGPALVLDVRAELGECPVWDPVARCLYFVDILRGHVHRFDPATNASRVYEIGGAVGAVALTDGGGLLLAVQQGFAALDLATGAVTPIAALEPVRPDLRMNDGKCDPAGRFWAGTMAFNEQVGAGTLYRLDPDGRVHAVLHDVTISNGLDWSNDRRMMFYVDSPTRSIDLFDFDPAAGTVANRRSLVRIPDEDGIPDGLTLDADGCVWVALWGGGAVHRYTPDGSRDAVIGLPTRCPTSCTFGGADLCDLYITTASMELSPEERARQPAAGGLFRARPGVRGRPPNRYGSISTVERDW